MTHFVDIVLHLDAYLNSWAGDLGPWLYVILFLIIFCETGLVVTPFLPGDSLLFAVGALTAVDQSPINVILIGIVLTIAAILGDSVNYWIGKNFSHYLLSSRFSRFIKQAHLERTKAFYEKHGGKTIVFARYMPIIRTFAPFVAGMAEMNYAKFAFYNVLGAVLWIWSFLIGGHFFGNLPAVKDNFHIVIIAIIIVSCFPILIEWVRLKTTPSRVER